MRPRVLGSWPTASASSGKAPAASPEASRASPLLEPPGAGCLQTQRCSGGWAIAQRLGRFTRRNGEDSPVRLQRLRPIAAPPRNAATSRPEPHDRRRAMKGRRWTALGRRSRNDDGLRLDLGRDVLDRLAAGDAELPLRPVLGAARRANDNTARLHLQAVPFIWCMVAPSSQWLRTFLRSRLEAETRKGPPGETRGPWERTLRLLHAADRTARLHVPRDHLRRLAPPAATDPGSAGGGRGSASRPRPPLSRSTPGRRPSGGRSPDALDDRREVGAPVVRRSRRRRRR